MMIPDEIIDQVRVAADIVQVVSRYVQLKKTGRNHQGLCPFHQENTPSFSVNQEKQIFHCFGCGKGGNSITFLRLINNMTFAEAVRELADWYGIKIPEKKLDRQAAEQLSFKEKLYQANKQALDYFKNNLKDPATGREAAAYLDKRGLPSEIIDEFSLGFATDRWDGLVRYLEKLNVGMDLAERAGLVVPRKGGGGYYDRFRNRVIFPIIDLNNRVIGFGGRVMGDELPKYLNSPQTEVYDKSSSLYGLGVARAHARQDDEIIIVEGYMDLLALASRGIRNVAAVLGTALTQMHVRLLQRYVSRVAVIFDSDAAGLKAAERSLEHFMICGLPARVVVLPAGLDPDNYVSQAGPEAFREAVTRARPLFDFYVDRLIQKHGLTSDGKILILKDVCPIFEKLPGGPERSIYIHTLAEALKVNETTIAQGLEKPSSGKEQAPPSAPTKLTLCTPSPERIIVATVLAAPETTADFIEAGVVDEFEDEALRSLALKLSEIYQELGCRESTITLDQLDDEEHLKIATRILMAAEPMPPEEENDLVADLIWAMDRRRLIKKNNSLTFQIETAKMCNDVCRLTELMGQKLEIARILDGAGR
ncbi:MAG: DNA primase [Deltaproteobacteria bacterium]|nr:DNA primase [Deltaproteobacteria bacterium]